jgi:hypothetical protein
MGVASFDPDAAAAEDDDPEFSSIADRKEVSFFAVALVGFGFSCCLSLSSAILTPLVVFSFLIQVTDLLLQIPDNQAHNGPERACES